MFFLLSRDFFYLHNKWLFFSGVEFIQFLYKWGSAFQQLLHLLNQYVLLLVSMVNCYIHIIVELIINSIISILYIKCILRSCLFYDRLIRIQMMAFKQKIFVKINDFTYFQFLFCIRILCFAVILLCKYVNFRSI